LEDIKQSFVNQGIIPYCSHCKGIVKSATISFGQAMPTQEMQRSEAATSNCDMFIAIGSSLVVYPAAGFPRMAKQNGASLVILNNQQTDLDPIADLVIHKQIGETLSAVID
jgi:NAD-dependent deacetylase